MLRSPKSPAASARGAGGGAGGGGRDRCEDAKQLAFQGFHNQNRVLM